MEKTRNLSAWAEAGYALFAEEGPGGIQVERLARILQLNKSGFYHYFGGLDVFHLELLALHQKKTVIYMDDLRCVQRIDPEYFEVVVRHKIPVMFQLHLIRRNDPTSARVAGMIDQEEEFILRDAWSEYLGLHENPDLAMRYFSLVHDMCYTRMSSKNISSVYLCDLVTEAKVVMQGITQSNAPSSRIVPCV